MNECECLTDRATTTLIDDYLAWISTDYYVLVVLAEHQQTERESESRHPYQCDYGTGHLPVEEHLRPREEEQQQKPLGEREKARVCV